MKFDKNKATFSKNLKVKYEGKIVSESNTHLTIEGLGEDSYIKLLRKLIRLF